MENKETLIQNVSERGSMVDILKLTSYVTKHEDEFEISDRFVNLSGEKLTKRKYEKIQEITDILDKNVRFFYYIYSVKNNFGEIQYYVNIHEGLNGGGDFIFDDMTNVYSTLLKMRKITKWVSLTEMDVDICDDVSTWGVTFML